MRYLTLFCLTVALTFTLFSNTSTAFEGNVNLTLGAKGLDGEYWDPVEMQNEDGIRVDFRDRKWPINIAVDWSRSSKNEKVILLVPGLGATGANAKGSTEEWNLGVRKIWEPNKKMRPYFGGGIAFIKADFEVNIPGMETVKGDDSAVGYWFGGGIYWTLAEHFNLGADLRYSEAKVTILDAGGEAGGAHFGFLAGYHW